MRLAKLSIIYNLGTDTLIDFLLRNGYEGQISTHAEIEESYIELIEKKFKSDRITKEFSKKQKATSIFKDYNYETLKKIPKNFSLRIKIDNNSSFTYKDIFGGCFWGCKNIVCIDPYIRQPKQFKNVFNLITIIKEFSINKINFQLLTCFDRSDMDNKSFIDKELNKIKSKVDDNDFLFSYTIEKPDFYHDRHIYVDDRFLVDLSRGLDIFQSLKDSNTIINKQSTFFITRLK